MKQRIYIDIVVIGKRYMMMKIFTLFFVVLAYFPLRGQSSKSALFIGNSYTGVNNLPSLTQNLANSLGDTLTVDSNTPGGSTFNAHTSNTTTLNKIALGGWDYVILQAQSQEPSFPPVQVATDTYPYATILVDSILSADPCTVPLFFMTWGRENGDQTNCASYPPICTFNGMQERLRQSYLEMSIDNEAEVSPVGAAWKYVRDNYPSIDLYSSDGSHPSIYGSYLAACVHYASIFKKSPVGASFISSLSATDALTLQTVAEMVVIDSLETWNFGIRNVTADFSSIINDFEVAFGYTGNNGNVFEWDFGDGTTDLSENPMNTYMSNGTYTVELIATDGCTSDTTTANVVISASTSNVNELNFIESVARFDDQVTITFNGYPTGSYLIYESTGRLVASGDFGGSSLRLKIPGGCGYYLLTVKTKNQTQTIKLVP